MTHACPHDAGPPLTREDAARLVRRLRALPPDARMTELGMPNFGPSFKVSCENHGGPGLVGVTQWDAKAGKWNLIDTYKPTDMDVIQPLIMEDSEAYASENNIAMGCS